MKKMVYYEIKKVFSRASSKIAVLLLLMLFLMLSYFTLHDEEYVHEDGTVQTGITAVRQLREERKKWSGRLSQEQFAKVIEENARVNNETGNEPISALSKKQGFYDISTMLNRAYTDFGKYDYTVIDSLTPEDAKNVYSNRVIQLEKWLDTDQADGFSEQEKAYLVEQFKKLETPLFYDWSEGWQQFQSYSISLFTIMVFILGFLVAGIFSGEAALKADSIFLSAYYGRRQAVLAKLAAGLLIGSGIYWVMVLLYSAVVFALLGTDGADCMIQTSIAGWMSGYNITFLQQYLLTIAGGYIGILFILLLMMFVSAKTKSTKFAVIIPFAVVMLPSVLAGIANSVPLIEKILGLLPDQLLNMCQLIQYFSLYQINGETAGSLKILLPMYGLLSILLCPVIYQVYRRAEVK
ncbi:MAG: ABC transporter permease [Clostridium sp.]|nr:ABC transporter permease [Clostridium sp.]